MKSLIFFLFLSSLSPVWADDLCLQNGVLRKDLVNDVEQVVDEVNPSVVYIVLNTKVFKKDSPAKTKKFVEDYFLKKKFKIESLFDSETISSLYMLNKNYKLDSTLFFLDTIEEKATKKIQSHPLVKNVSFQKGSTSYAKYEIKLVRSVYERELSSVLSLVPKGFNRRYSALSDSIPDNFILSLDIATNSAGKPLSRQEALEIVDYFSGRKSEGVISAEALYRNTYEIKFGAKKND